MHNNQNLNESSLNNLIYHKYHQLIGTKYKYLNIYGKNVVNSRRDIIHNSNL